MGTGQTAGRAGGAERPYHHGDLRRALVAAAVELVAEAGVEAVSVREVARRAGVSPGAPFRHFPHRTALLTAVAEEAMDRLSISVRDALEAAAGEPALRRFRAIGVAFLGWALANPAHFEVISTRAVIDYAASTIPERNAAIRAVMTSLLAEAQAAGALGRQDPETVLLNGRALVYGLARMHLDGQFPSWGLPQDEPLAASIALLDGYIDAIARPA